MQFANIDNNRSLPLMSGQRASCPACRREVIARCGMQRVRHWAHLGARSCDPWLENETPWHRAWKEPFPETWREVIRFASSGEKHIADVHTAFGLTIEIQRSPISTDERKAREDFYGNMVWIVDGSRLKRDLSRFVDGARKLRPFLRDWLHLTAFPEELFSNGWLYARVPVLFDFERASDPEFDAHPAKLSLWCILPGRVFGRAVVLRVRREDFVSMAHTSAHPVPTGSIMRDVERVLRAQQEYAPAARLEARTAQQQPWRRGRQRRRF